MTLVWIAYPEPPGAERHLYDSATAEDLIRGPGDGYQWLNISYDLLHSIAGDLPEITNGDVCYCDNDQCAARSWSVGKEV